MLTVTDQILSYCDVITQKQRTIEILSEIFAALEINVGQNHIIIANKSIKMSSHMFH
jgi:hypothetical protein